MKSFYIVTNTTKDPDLVYTNSILDYLAQNQHSYNNNQYVLHLPSQDYIYSLHCAC